MSHSASAASENSQCVPITAALQDEDGGSILHWCILNDRLPLLQENLDGGLVDINVRNTNGETPLLCALRLPNKASGHQFARKLLDAGADVNLSDHQGTSPLHVVCQFPLLEDQEDTRLFSLVSGAGGCDFVARDEQGQTALHLVQSPNAAEELIGRGCRVNALDNLRNSPLHASVKRPHVARTLIENGANLNLANVAGCVPLHLAVVENCLDSVQLLIRSGANVNVRNGHGLTPFAMWYFCSWWGSADRSADIKNELWNVTDPLWLIAAVVYEDCEDLLKFKWRGYARLAEQAFSFLNRLAKFLARCNHIDKVVYGRVIVKYFIEEIQQKRLVDRKKTLHLVRQFNKCLEVPLLNFLITQIFNYCQIGAATDISHTFVSLGATVDYHDIWVIYSYYGDCPLLHSLLRQEVGDRLMDLQQLQLFPRILSDVSLDIVKVLNNCVVSGLNIVEFLDLHNLARYCTLPTILRTEICAAYRNIMRLNEYPTSAISGLEEALQELNGMSRVPSLMELSRNAARSAICCTYGISRLKELHLALQDIGLPPLIQELIAMEIPIYFNIKRPQYVGCIQEVYLL